MMGRSDEAVLVTGGAGYIGSHICKHLASTGYIPVTYDNLSTGHADAVRWGPLEIGDVGDRQRLDEVLDHHRPVAAIHLAASSLVGESVEKPLAYYRNNVGGALTLIEAIAHAKIEVFVFSSTCAVYGMPDSEVISETHPCRPVNPYGSTKLIIEHLLKDVAATGALRYASLRYFNAAGADPDAETGESHEPETHLLPLVLRAARGELPEIRIFGDDYPTRDGTCIRDYIDVNDLAEAHRLALEKLLADKESMVLNLGTGSGNSVLEVIEAAERVVGCDIAKRICARREGDPPSLVASGSLARRVLGWEPRSSSLDEIIRRAWRWERKKVRS